MPLLESGTGISQVLAMLYIVVTAESDRVIIIDEPNSFLHPGAVRSLLEILREHPRHQYIISTHAPQTIASVTGSSLVHLVKKNADLTSTVERIDPANIGHVREVLSSVGARLSDVFGSESILWVEGATEEHCFRLVVEKALHIPLRSISIVGVLHTADFDRRNARWALEVYTRLSKAGGLMPPAIGFIFDRDMRTPIEMEDIRRQSHGAVTFLSTRMYENYLLVPAAIASVLEQRGTSVSTHAVTQALDARLADPKFFPKGDTFDRSNIDGWKVLQDLFWVLSSEKTVYEKVTDGSALTTWLLDHDSLVLSPIAELLREKLVESPQSSAPSAEARQ